MTPPAAGGSSAPAGSRRFLAPLVIAGLLVAQGLFLYFTRHEPQPPLPVTVSVAHDAARLASLVGGVQISTSAGIRQASNGDELMPGDRISTAVDGRAEIEMPEIGVLILDAGSTLERTTEKDRRFGFFLHAGRMLVQTTAASETELPACYTPHASFVPESGHDNEFLVLAEP